MPKAEREATKRKVSRDRRPYKIDRTANLPFRSSTVSCEEGFLIGGGEEVMEWWSGSLGASRSEEALDFPFGHLQLSSNPRDIALLKDRLDGCSSHPPSFRSTHRPLSPNTSSVTSLRRRRGGKSS
jgi:hypothetical protein